MKNESVRHVNLVPIFSNSFSFSNSWGKKCKTIRQVPIFIGTKMNSFHSTWKFERRGEDGRRQERQVEERRGVKRGSRYFSPYLDVLKIKREERTFDVVDPLIMLQSWKERKGKYIKKLVIISLIYLTIYLRNIKDKIGSI